MQMGCSRLGEAPAPGPSSHSGTLDDTHVLGREKAQSSPLRHGPCPALLAEDVLHHDIPNVPSISGVLKNAQGNSHPHGKIPGP